MTPNITFQNRPWLWTAILAAVAMLVLSACIAEAPQPAPEQPAKTDGREIPELLIEVSEDGILVPDTAPGGIVSISVQNTGQQEHEVSLWRLREGHTQEEVLVLDEYLKENPDDFFGVFELSSWINIVDHLGPGATRQYYADLGVGDFFLMDETNPDLAPVFFSATELVGTTEPAADVTVDMADFSYDMADAIPAGEQLWELTNSGEQWHLAAIITANPDATLEEIEASFGGPDTPPPADAVVEVLGGMPPMSPGERVWMTFDLEPGDYELVCPLPDIVAMMAGGPPLSHMSQGMRHVFTVGN